MKNVFGSVAFSASLKVLIMESLEAPDVCVDDLFWNCLISPHVGLLMDDLCSYLLIQSLCCASLEPLQPSVWILL